MRIRHPDPTRVRDRSCGGTWNHARMVDYLVLVNGLPGSGKTTLANQLASAMDVPAICKDVLKEAMAAALPGIPARD